MRARGSSIPVLILTAADSVEERVKGLDYGADDYMAKPFSLQELEARVRALTRRGMGGSTNTIKHGPLEYDQAGRVATIDGKMVELSARELGLLEVLLQRAGRLVSKDQLVERLCEWGEEVSDNTDNTWFCRLLSNFLAQRIAAPQRLEHRREAAVELVAEFGVGGALAAQTCRVDLDRCWRGRPRLRRTRSGTARRSTRRRGSHRVRGGRW